MLIECTIRREGGTLIENLYGKAYRFLPNDDGAHVCEVEDEAAVDAFLAIPEGYRLARRGASAPKPVVEKPVKRDTKAQLPAGAPPDLASMNREALDQYAVNLGMRKPHPKMKDDRVRQNIALWLAERAEDVVAPFGVDDADETEADE